MGDIIGNTEKLNLILYKKGAKNWDVGVNNNFLLVDNFAKNEDTRLTNAESEIDDLDIRVSSLEAYTDLCGIGVTYWRNDDPAVYGDRIILLQGQIIEIASYSNLVTKLYCGNANNPTAPAFYKCTDMGVRDTDGEYFKLPDHRAVAPVMTGQQTINTRLKEGPGLGEILEDRFQTHNHKIIIYDNSTSGGSNPYGSNSTNASDWWTEDPYDGGYGTPRTGDSTEINRIGVKFGVWY